MSDQLLELFLANTKKNFLLDGVNFHIIKKIKWELNVCPTSYEKYDRVSQTYTQEFTEPEPKFTFTLDVENIPHPIKICCLNSGKKSPEDMGTYRPANPEKYLNEIIDYPGMGKFIKYLSKNNLSHVITNFGYILGHIVNSFDLY